jgi:hypothetical protein
MPAQRKPRGRGWHGDSKGHAKAGALGGQTTAKTQGDTFYSTIGRLGGLANKKRRRRRTAPTDQT